MSDGESVHSRAILSKAATGGRRGLKLNKRTQSNIYFQVLIRTSSGISISRKGALKLVNLSSLKIIHLKEQRYTFAKSRNFADVCMVGTQTSPLPYTRLENFETSRSLTLITFHNNSQTQQLYKFRRYLQRCRRIFTNGPISKLEKTVEWSKREI